MADNSSSPTTIFQEKLKSYQLLHLRVTGKELGAGGYATVEEAVIPGEYCAVKKVDPDWCNENLMGKEKVEAVAKQYAMECCILSTLDHQNIVKFLGIHKFADSILPAIVMERLHISLHDIMTSSPYKPKHQLSLSLKCSILCDIARALYYIHCKQNPSIVYCDLSARNVVLSKEMEAKIIDLGSARYPTSCPCAVEGTPVYTPPEVNGGMVPKIHPSLDIYSLGLLTVFLVTDTEPTIENKNKISHDRKQFIDGVNKKLSDQLHSFGELIKKCLNNDPDKRPDIGMVKSTFESTREYLQQNISIVNLDIPYGIAINGAGELVISEWGSHRVSVMNSEGKILMKFGSFGDEPGQMKYPAGIAVHGETTVYVSSQHKVQKFFNGKLDKYIGKKGQEVEEFNDPRGLAVYENCVYVCDRRNHRIQVFDLNLNFVEAIPSNAQAQQIFDEPFDINFDTNGIMYVADFKKCTVQVLKKNVLTDTIVCSPTALPIGLHVANGKVYVSDFKHDCVVVYNTTDKKHMNTIGKGEKGLCFPYCITSRNDTLFVCDSANHRVFKFNLGV